jgi:hypothetical protein
VSRRKAKSGRISVFKGREARLNKAIFQILAQKGPQTIYDIHKEMKNQKRLRHFRYASVNKRARVLQETGYIKRIGSKKTKAGFKSSLYELTTRAYLATLLDSINMEELVRGADDATSSIILGSILGAYATYC